MQISYSHESAHANSSFSSHAYSNGTHTSAKASETASPNIDEMMQDIEKKALKNEIEELRAKLAKYERGE